MEGSTDKIYRRPTQSAGTSQKRVRDEKNRRRNTIMNFRVTPQEKQLIEARIRMSGLPKAEFFLQSCLYQKILVKGNSKIFSAMQSTLKDIDNRMAGITDVEEIDAVLLEEVQTIREILKASAARKTSTDASTKRKRQ